MTEDLYWLLTASFAAVAVVLLYYVTTSGSRRTRVTALLVLAVGAWILYTLTPSLTQTRSSTDEVIVAVIAYFAMVLGMIAQYFYVQAEGGATRVKFEWLPFLMPLLASPIIFIPLVSIAVDAGGGGAFTRQKLMVYLVAFQNGFFWKQVFDQRRVKAGDSVQAPTALQP
jgi:hypothetical protein